MLVVAIPSVNVVFTLAGRPSYTAIITALCALSTCNHMQQVYIESTVTDVCLSFPGVLVQLSYPYPRAVSEPAMYEDANVVTTGLTDEEVEQLKERLEPKSHPASSKKRVSSSPSSSVTSEVASSTASSVPSESMSVSAQLQPYLSVS